MQLDTTPVISLTILSIVIYQSVLLSNGPDADLPTIVRSQRQLDERSLRMAQDAEERRWHGIFRRAYQVVSDIPRVASSFLPGSADKSNSSRWYNQGQSV